MMGIFSGKLQNNILKVELALESMRLPYERNGCNFIVYKNRYRNNERDFTTLNIHVNKHGVFFTDAKNDEITSLPEDYTAPEKVPTQLLNIFGLLTKGLLVTK